MKKELIKKVAKEGYYNKNLKKFRPLLKGLKVTLSDMILYNNEKDSYIKFCMIDDSILKIMDERMHYFNKNGLYYLELRKSFNNKKNLVYLSYYDKLKIYELRNLDSEAIINPKSFSDFGIRPDFSNQYSLDELKDKKQSFVEIINKKMLNSKKRTKKLVKKI